MNKAKILPAVLLCGASLSISSAALANDFFSGVSHATHSVATGVGHVTKSVVGGVVHGTEYVVHGVEHTTTDVWHKMTAHHHS